jgi:ATP-dependent DNA helicase RecQ
MGLEPRIVSAWLEPLGLDIATLLGETATRQAEIIRFCLPAADIPPTAEERAGLAVLGWAVGDYILQNKPARSVLLALFDLFLSIDEPEVAGYLFNLAYPEPEPSRVTYFSHLVELRLAQGDIDSAGEVAAQMQQLYPGRFSTLVTQAEICLHRADFEGAKAAYLHARQDSPDSNTLVLGLARCAFRQGAHEEAREWLERLEELQPSWNVLRQMAYLWRELGEEARAASSEAAYQAKRALKIAELRREHPVTQESELEVLPDLAVTPSEARLEETAYRALKEVFGHDQFRPGQEQVIASVLAGQDTLAVLPTGAGKSLCYQLPALLLTRPVLVLSPLISLMKDQYDKLPPLLKPHSLVINSSLEPGEAARHIRDLSRPGNTIRLIYAAPERLRQQSFVAALRRAHLGLLVVDEAHCVAMWGNDFRPDYLFIKKALADLAGAAPALLAVTATATPEVAAEIGRQLGRDLKLVRGSVFRPNLRFGVEKVKSGGENRLQRVAELCAGLEGSGIIYARSREKCEQIAEYLNRQGIVARYYHAGMDSTERRTTQESWSAGKTRVIAATVAFGMGIDKADVRFIIHYNPPAALENYLQEAGRAGRDGQPSDCRLLYSSGDKSNLTRWLREERELMSLDLLRTLYRAVTRNLSGARRGIVLAEDLPRGVSDGAALLDETVVRVGLSLLERAGLLERGYDLPSSAEVILRQPQLGLFELETRPAGFEEFIQAAQLSPGRSITLDLVELADRLGWDAPALEIKLAEWDEAGWLNYFPARRDYYLELKEAGNDARARLEDILNQMQIAADQRLDRLEDYLHDRTCRQLLLARHFGEKLARPCGVCDNCDNTSLKRSKTAFTTSVTASPVIERPAGNAAKPANLPSSLASNNSGPIKADFLIGAILKAAQEAEEKGGLSRTALSQILLAKESASNLMSSNSQWGVLEARFGRKELTAHIDKLIEQGLLNLTDHEITRYGRVIKYNVVMLGEAGRDWLDNHSSNLSHTTPVSAVKASPVVKPAKITEEEATRFALGCLELVTGEGEARVGRSGLVRLLQGQPSALGTRAANRYKGSLEGKLKVKETEALIERLVTSGLIEEESVSGLYGRSYQALRVSEAGRFWLEENSA